MNLLKSKWQPARKSREEDWWGCNWARGRRDEGGFSAMCVVAFMWFGGARGAEGLEGGSVVVVVGWGWVVLGGWGWGGAVVLDRVLGGVGCILVPLVARTLTSGAWRAHFGMFIHSSPPLPRRPLYWRLGTHQPNNTNSQAPLACSPGTQSAGPSRQRAAERCKS